MFKEQAIHIIITTFYLWNTLVAQHDSYLKQMNRKTVQMRRHELS